MTKPPDRPPTLQDVAREAGVSVATASRAINGSTRRVRDDLRVRVLEAASRLDYRPNVHAQAVARGRTSVIGLLVHDVADPYFSGIAKGAIAEAERRGLLVTLASTQRSPERELAHLTALRGQRAQGVIIAGSRFDDAGHQARLRDELERFTRAGGRATLISQDILGVNTVHFENRVSGRDLATRLTELGYRRFGLLSAPPGLLTAAERSGGFADGLAAAGVGEVVAIGHGEFTRDGGYAAMHDVLDEGHDLDCVVGMSDVMAVGAMTALRDRGFRLPEDMAVAGFNDIPTLRDLSPAMTTVRHPLVEVGTMAMEMTLSDDATPRVRHVRGEVIIRESTPDRR